MILYLCVGAILGGINAYYDILQEDSACYHRGHRIAIFSASVILWFPILLLVELGQIFKKEEEKT